MSVSVQTPTEKWRLLNINICTVVYLQRNDDGNLNDIPCHTHNMACNFCQVELPEQEREGAGDVRNGEAGTKMGGWFKVDIRTSFSITIMAMGGNER